MLHAMTTTIYQLLNPTLEIFDFFSLYPDELDFYINMFYIKLEFQLQSNYCLKDVGLQGRMTLWDPPAEFSTAKTAVPVLIFC